MSSRSRNSKTGDKPIKPPGTEGPADLSGLPEQAKPEDYTHDKLEAGDLLDSLTDTFDDDIDLPRT
jgi:hypothetical protein